MKAHDIFPGVCYPDYFWEQARDHIEENWYLMCPHEILKTKGYALEDSFGEEWKEKVSGLCGRSADPTKE